MTNPRSALQQTVSVLRERGIDINQEELHVFFDDPQHAGEATAWVDECLVEVTLLSKEEATLYAKLQSNGIAKSIETSIETSNDFATLKPILEDDLRSAISSLKTSTAAIEKQTETLKAQWKLMEDFKSRNYNTEVQSTKGHEQFRRRHALEKQHVAVTTEELFQDFKSKLRDSQDHAEKATRAVNVSVVDNLKEDDGKLRGLEEMGEDTGLHTFEAKDLGSRTAKLTSKLADYETKGLECRLDRIYLDTSYKILSGHSGRKEDSNQAAALKHELDTLYNEIRVLAEMATKQEFKAPIMKAVYDQEAHVKANSRARLTYASRVLDYLRSCSEERQRKLQTFAAHRRALDALAVSFQNELRDADSSQSQSLVETNGRMTSPPKGVAARHEDYPEVQAVATFLRHLGITPASRGEVKADHGEFEEAVIARKERLNEMIRRLDSMVDSSVSASLSPSQSALELLSIALHADSTTGKPNLSERELEALLSQLEERMQVVAKSIEDTDMDVVHRRDKRLERFLEKWKEVD